MIFKYRKSLWDLLSLNRSLIFLSIYFRVYFCLCGLDARKSAPSPSRNPRRYRNFSSSSSSNPSILQLYSICSAKSSKFSFGSPLKVLMLCPPQRGDASCVLRSSMRWSPINFAKPWSWTLPPCLIPYHQVVHSFPVDGFGRFYLCHLRIHPAVYWGGEVGRTLFCSYRFVSRPRLIWVVWFAKERSLGGARTQDGF